MKAATRLFLCIAGIAAAAAGMTIHAEAQNYPWCSNFADGAGTNCGFSTQQQCMTTIAGSGGYCEQNNQYKSSAPAPHADVGAQSQRPRRHRRQS
jgi:hypothetical protein